MPLLCTQDFKDQYEKIMAKPRHYGGFPKDLIQYIFKKKPESQDGSLLRYFGDNFYMKKRIGGAGGYRIYYFVYVTNDATVLLYAHPKTGPLGVESVSKEQRKALPLNMFKSIKENNYYEVTANKDNTSLVFKKV